MKKLYLHRDVSWMYFNHRILEEAMKESVPVLERLSFLGIFSNNQDEFFRVRVASISRIAESEGKSTREEREEAIGLLKTINKLNSKYSKEYQQAVTAVTEALRKENIYIVREGDIDEAQIEYVQDYFRKNLSGMMSPIWLDRIKRFDDEADDCVYLCVKMWKEGAKQNQYAVIPLPVDSVGRFVRLPEKSTDEAKINYIMYLDDVVRCCMPLVFPGLGDDHFEVYSFKFTKDAEMEIDNDLRNGFLQKISKGVKSRRQGLPLRLVYDNNMPKGMLRQIMSKLDQGGKLDTAVAGGKYQNHRDLMSFPDCGRKDLKYPVWPSILKKELAGEESIFDVIRKKDRFIHVPYHNFDSYIRLLYEAAINPKVKTIRTTLYRLAKDSKVIRALICAARNGKKVTVVIELLARFDEASNISWSKKMQDAGVHVIFGVEGLKIHSKITHIGFNNGSSIACISTGNFHEGNARCYTDVMLMTAHRNITGDVDKVFKFIERPYAPVKFKELLVSPNEMKKKFLALINNEIKNKLAGKPAYIRMKVNHITDPVMVEKIYDAAKAGVKIDLLIRGNCSLITDQPSFAGRLRVVSIIDRYLEHSRIFIFANGGEELYFMGSADWMPRNLDYRIEVVTPVYEPEIKAELRRIVDYGLMDTRQGRLVRGDGNDTPMNFIQPDRDFRSQEALYEYYLKKNEETPDDDSDLTTDCNIENNEQSDFIDTDMSENEIDEEIRDLKKEVDEVCVKSDDVNEESEVKEKGAKSKSNKTSATKKTDSKKSGTKKTATAKKVETEKTTTATENSEE